MRRVRLRSTLGLMILSWRRAVLRLCVELSRLVADGALPARILGAVPEAAVEIYERAGGLLGWEVTLRCTDGSVSVAWVAAAPGGESPLLRFAAVAGERNVGAVLEHYLRRVAAERTDASARLVIEPWPRLAVQVVRESREIALFDLETGVPVGGCRPGVVDSRSHLHVEEFPASPVDERERIGLSLFDNRPPSVIAATSVGLSREVVEYLSARRPRKSVDRLKFVHYRQVKDWWCVAACVQMVLRFHGVGCSQESLAGVDQLNLRAATGGLRLEQDWRVTDVIVRNSCGTLDAARHVDPAVKLFIAEVDAGRPSIAFSGNHARCVVGYAGGGALLVYDDPERPRGRSEVLENVAAPCIRGFTTWTRP